MHARRLLRHNRRPADSFNDSPHADSPSSNLLHKIRNQSLLLKLIGITLQLSQDAGLPKEELSALESQLLSSKGLQQYSVLSGE